jgi:Leucine-rich repeat (LRR) protein
MKNVLIVALVVAVLGLGGILIYDKSKNDDSTNSDSTTSSSSDASGKEVLDYSNKGLTSVGADIYDQTSAVELILSNNQITSLPSEMGKMTKLQVLRLDNNQLEGSLIAEIRKMSLVLLDASNNRLTGVPAEIGQLNQLETLNFDGNNITEFPNEIANISGNLKELNVHGNPLTSETIQKLKDSLPNTNIIF